MDYCIVFDFKDNDSFPETRLSLFVQVDGNVRHGESIKLYNEATDLEWKCSGFNLVKIEKNEKQWAGTCNFYPVKNEIFPAGNYTVTYEDKAERDSETVFTLYYPNELLACKSADIPEVLKIPYKKKVAVYSNKDELLFWGEEPAKWHDSDDVLMDYHNAWSKRVCYTFNKNTIYCLLPPVELGNKDYEKEIISEEN